MSARWNTWLEAFRPKPFPVSFAERLKSAAGAFVGIGLTALISILIARYYGLSLWLVAPLGASAVLVFAVPASPLAEPWSVVGGNTLSAIVGVICVWLIPDQALSAAVAVGLAIAVMFATRSLHPPGGAMALLVVMSEAHNLSYALFPAFTNSLLLVLVGIAFNRLAGRSYPHVTPAPVAETNTLHRVSEADIQAALRQFNTVLDISTDDVEKLLILSERHAYQRLMDRVRAEDIMTAEPISVSAQTALDKVHSLMSRKDLWVLPVIDHKKQVLGVITADSFLGVSVSEPVGLAKGLRRLMRKPALTAADIMSGDFITATPEAEVASLIPMFADHGRHHLLIVDEHQHLRGIISASDVMRAVYHVTREG
ncbi:MAG: HPP family protein [Asticcacaulis sp.]